MKPRTTCLSTRINKVEFSSFRKTMKKVNKALAISGEDPIISQSAFLRFIITFGINQAEKIAKEIKLEASQKRVKNRYQSAT